MKQYGNVLTMVQSNMDAGTQGHHRSCEHHYYN